MRTLPFINRHMGSGDVIHDPDSAYRRFRSSALILAALAGATTTASTAQAPVAGRLAVDAVQALAAAPKARISNGILDATILLPDARRGFYRGTRFDWSGLVASLKLGRQEYYGLWFDRIALDVRDFVFDGDTVTAGPNTALVGPAEAFDVLDPPGWRGAGAGGGFLKIGVGVLRKPGDGVAYSPFRPYDIVNGGRWIIHPARDHIEFRQTLTDPATGFGYIYRKTIRLVPGKPEMRIEHSLTNTGTRSLSTQMFNHNFLTLGHGPAADGFRVTMPFAIGTTRQPDATAARIDGNAIVYRRSLKPAEVVALPVTGYGTEASGYDFRLADAHGTGVAIKGDRPLSRLQLWSIRPVVAIEPYVSLVIDRGQTVRWSFAYDYSAAGAEPDGS
jgi:hypothetical protein